MILFKNPWFDGIDSKENWYRSYKHWYSSKHGLTVRQCLDLLIPVRRATIYELQKSNNKWIEVKEVPRKGQSHTINSRAVFSSREIRSSL